MHSQLHSNNQCNISKYKIYQENKKLTRTLAQEFQYVFQKLKEQPQTDLLHSNHIKDPSNQNHIKTFIKKISSEHHRDRLVNEFFALGPIESLINNNDISEIIINGRMHILYEKKGQLIELNDHFLSDLTFSNFIHRICEEGDMILTLNHPFANGHWKGWRVHIVMKPVVHVNYHLSFRRHPKNPWTFSKLIDQDWAPKHAVDLIKKLIQQKSNILICGPTSSGKTSVLNACLQHLSPSERVITIEDSNELLLPNHFSSKLITRTQVQENLIPIEQTELVRQSLRMRPDRIIMGEARGAEAKDLLMALSTGHQGSLGTIHAHNHKQALWRLEMLVQMGSPSWNTHTIQQMITLSINHFIILGRIQNARQHNHSQRILKGIYKLTGLEKTGFLFETLFVHDFNTQIQELFPMRDRGGR